MITTIKPGGQYTFFLILSFLIASCSADTESSYQDWKVYGGNKENIKYSSLTEIDTNNVKSIRIAWEYHTKDADSTSEMKTNPIVVDGVLYGLSPKLKLFALDAATGEEKWVYDPVYIRTKGKNWGMGDFAFVVNTSRGLAFYQGENGDKRIFYTPGGGHLLYCIDANTGKPVKSFGTDGFIDLHDDLGRDADHLHVSNTTPGIIYKDLIIMGSRISEAREAAPGHIRAYDVHTGKLRWRFHTIPQPGEEGFDSWDDKEAYKYIGGANVWGGFSLDEERGIVFAPTGSANYDFYGGMRLGNNFFSSSLLALDAATGKLKWHFQTVHHDVWDRDVPTAPSLVTVTKDGKDIDAVAQVSKTGFIYVLERETGKPVHPIEEVPVPTDTDLVGERLSPTQPVPTFYQPFVRQTLTEADINPHLPDSSYQEVKKRLATYKTGNMWNGPSQQGTIVFPGYSGGAEWGGSSFDPATGILYVNANEMANVLTMVEVEDEKQTSEQTNLEAGMSLYRTTCKGCHGIDRTGGQGNPALGDNPSLVGLEKRFNESQFKNLISTGRNKMPAFSQLTEGEKDALASYILNLETKQQQKFVSAAKEKSPYFKLKYIATGYNKFLSQEGYPAVAPPWGTLSAINLNTGELVWKTPLGEYPELKEKGIHSGTENYGGSVVTAGGLLFIAATKDEKFRAFNKLTGELLWETKLPAAAYATPAVYQANGKQYVVIACGGGGYLKTKSGDSYIAFALPEK
ncbi:quinoprotein glucose dehydrogenase [Flammeovirgaceae bacterium 311]|nr:quinoprotein glucose dehydrogenase [Flammeovirgaceae bacterium 311]